ncbi:unnamed protein product [Brassicogethes aeneus]|uniref:Isopropylmalate dehydrogenase-like domain-containing protein n=1 Tax=Brassicogethes aeneus TaxID=1431903 RepID=A0A9P0AQU0_BRAAE|nr:unnamed protein product [Brassicogethes aeneus]
MSWLYRSAKTLSRLTKLMARYKSDFQIQQALQSKEEKSLPLSLYGGIYTVAMVPGGGSGPQLMKYVEEVITASGAPITFEVVNMFEESSDQDLDDAIVAVKRNRVALKGKIQTQGDNIKSTQRDAKMMIVLDLYVNVLHAQSLLKIRPEHDADIIVVTQNTEGEYTNLEHQNVKGVVESMKICTRGNSEKAARYAFECARKESRRKVTTVHKAQVYQLSDGLFLETAQKVSKEYPDIEHDDLQIDTTCKNLVQNPKQFDVILTTNLYGDVISNIVCGLLKGPGFLCSKNYGDSCAVFEAVDRHDNPDETRISPIALLNAAVEMLNHFGHFKHVDQIREAIFKTICQDEIKTPDMGGVNSTLEVVERIIERVKGMDTRRW